MLVHEHLNGLSHTCRIKTYNNIVFLPGFSALGVNFFTTCSYCSDWPFICEHCIISTAVPVTSDRIPGNNASLSYNGVYLHLPSCSTLSYMNLMIVLIYTLFLSIMLFKGILKWYKILILLAL